MQLEAGLAHPQAPPSAFGESRMPSAIRQELPSSPLLGASFLTARGGAERCWSLAHCLEFILPPTLTKGPEWEVCVFLFLIKCELKRRHPGVTAAHLPRSGAEADLFWGRPPNSLVHWEREGGVL